MPKISTLAIGVVIDDTGYICAQYYDKDNNLQKINITSEVEALAEGKILEALDKEKHL